VPGGPKTNSAGAITLTEGARTAADGHAIVVIANSGVSSDPPIKVGDYVI
jgi:hypothetical protein